MYKQIIAVALLLVCTVASAVTIVSDPTTMSPQPTSCGWYMDGGAKEVLAVGKNTQNQAFCTKTIDTIAAGSHTVQASFVIEDSTWGTLEGPKSSPLAFTRPALSSAPSGLKLSP